MKSAFPILAHRLQGAHGLRNQPAGGLVPTDKKPPGDGRAEESPAIWAVRGFLLAEIAIILVIVSIHFGLLIDGYRHQNAGATELLLATVMVAGLLLTWTPRWRRPAAITVQSFGTMGVMLGLFTIAVGIGPRTILDLSLNGILLLTLIAGLRMMLRKP